MVRLDFPDLFRIHLLHQDGFAPMRKAHTMNFFALRCLRTLGLAAMVVGGMVAPKAHAGLVYSTASSSGTPVASSGNIFGTPSQTNSVALGVFGSGAAPVALSWNATAANAGRPAVSFNTAATGNLLKLNGIGINLSLDDAGGSSQGETITGANLVWRLYDGASLKASYTQTISGLAHAGGGAFGPNTYFGVGTASAGSTSSWALSSAAGTDVLVNSHNYTMFLESFTVTSFTGAPNLNNDEVHWNWIGAGASAGTYSLSNTGTYTTAGGALTSSTTTMAFDIDATAVPEPSTLILYSAATGGFFLFSLLRWRKAKAALAPVAA